MPVVVVLEYLVSDRRQFIVCYKANLLPVARAAQGFRHIQVVRRGATDQVLILIEFDFAADYERFKKKAPPMTFPPPQDQVSEEVMWTLNNTNFPLANARQYTPAPKRQPPS